MIPEPAPDPVPRDPETPAEWQDAVDYAAALLALDAARQFGLVAGGPGVNVERCQVILRKGRTRGYHPRPADEAIAKFLR